VCVTHLMLSVCVLYSIMVLGGRLRTLRKVSLMRAVVAWSLAVLFQIEMISSFKPKHRYLFNTEHCYYDVFTGARTTCHSCEMHSYSKPQ